MAGWWLSKDMRMTYPDSKCLRKRAQAAEDKWHRSSAARARNRRNGLLNGNQSAFFVLRQPLTVVLRIKKLLMPSELIQEEVAMKSDAIHFVVVTTDDREQQMWGAAASRHEAVDRVLDAIPEGWTARLLDQPMKLDEHDFTDFSPGEIRQLYKP